jgi:hypothetical protein
VWWSPRSFARRIPGCRAAGLTQGNWTIRFGIPNGLVFTPPNAVPAFLVLGHEDIKGGLWAALQLAPLILLSLAILRTFRLDYPWWLFFSYDDLLSLGRLSLRWPNQDLLPLELDHVHICRERVLVELHLGTFCKFQSSFVHGRLNVSTENIAIVSSMRIRIMSFAIRVLFELFRQQYDMTTWQFNFAFPAVSSQRSYHTLRHRTCSASHLVGF